jgi:transcriptional regulator with XRE-family HTH domain
MIGRRVGEIMKERGLSPEQLANKADIPEHYISQLVAGQPLFGIPLDYKRKLADALGLREMRRPVGASAGEEEYLDSLFLPKLPEQGEFAL